MNNHAQDRVGYLCLQATRQGQASHAHVHEIIRGLRDEGWHVELFEPAFGDGAPPGVLGRLSHFAAVQSRFLRRAPRGAFYVRWHPLTFPAVAWAKLRSIPTVLEVNGSYEDMFIAWPWTRRLRSVLVPLSRWQLRWADRVVTVTPGNADWVRSEARGAQVEVIPNAANTDLFHPAAASTRELPDRFVLFFGSLARWHGIHTLLAAVESPAWPRGIRLVIAGKGAEAAHVVDAERRGALTYLGPVEYREMPGLIAASVAGLNPQTLPPGRAEVGLSPLKLYETLACGVPVIVTDYLGQADLIRRERCGLVIPPDDPAALAQAVARLADDPDETREMGLRARQATLARHSWRIRAVQTGEVLRQAMGAAA